MGSTIWTQPSIHARTAQRAREGMEWLLVPALRRLDHADGHIGEADDGGMDAMPMAAAGHEHHMVMDPSSPPPACRHCWYGHVVPGLYLLWLATLLFLEALAVRHRALLLSSQRSTGSSSSSAAPTAAGGNGGRGVNIGKRRWTVRQRTVTRLRVWSGLVAGPLLALGEALTHKSWHGGNVQHFTMYAILTLDGLVALQAGLRKRWPRGLLGVWEAGSMSLIGFQMGSHFHGGPMISRMHALMQPALTLVGALLFVDRVFALALPLSTREGLRLGACVGMASIALWFGSIGPGFWQYGGTHGWFGTSWQESGAEPDHETNMTLSTLATAIFLVAFVGVGTLWGLVVGAPAEGKDEEEDEEEGEAVVMPRGGRGSPRHARGGYVELQAKRGGSVDGSQSLGGGLEEGAGPSASHFRIGDEEEAAVVL